MSDGHGLKSCPVSSVACAVTAEIETHLLGRLPPVCEGIAFVHHTSIEVWLGWETRLVEPRVPVDFGESLRGSLVRLEKLEKCRLEFV